MHLRLFSDTPVLPLFFVLPFSEIQTPQSAFREDLNTDVIRRDPHSFRRHPSHIRGRNISPRTRSWRSQSRRRTILLLAGGTSNTEGTKDSVVARSIHKYETNLESYYLLSSKKVWFSIAAYTIGLAVAQSVLKRIGVSIGLPHSTAQVLTSSRVISKWILPHLASACCIIQLIGNLFLGVGCFGLNTYLGPLRPIFVSMLLLSSRVSLQQHLSWVTHLLIPWIIALMPEWIHLSNRFSVKRFTFAKQRENEDTTGGNQLLTAQLDMNIRGMGCVACIKKIDSSTRNSSANVSSASSWLLPKDNSDQKKGGKAMIVLKGTSVQDLESTATKVIEAVVAAGFHCESKCLRVLDGEG